MLEFIVSGHIPGTPITLTFPSVLAIASLIFGMSLARQIKKQNRVAGDKDLKDIVL